MAIKGLIFLKVSDWNLSYKQSKTTLDFYIRYPRMPYQTDQTKEMILTIHFYPSVKKGLKIFINIFFQHKTKFKIVHD